MPCLINYPNWAGTEYTGFLNQASHHNAMCSQQIIHRIGVKLVQPFVDFIGILDFGNILGRGQHLLAVQNCGDLF